MDEEVDEDLDPELATCTETEKPKHFAESCNTLWSMPSWSVVRTTAR